MKKPVFHAAPGMLLFSACSLFAQNTSPRFAFEVATIKSSAPLDAAAMKAGAAHIGTKVDGGRIDIATTSLLRLICTAYQVAPYQIAGPDWLKNANFDIQAKFPEGATSDRIPEMLRTLLEERFGLRLHHESREQQVYALVVARGGPKLKPATVESTEPPLAEPPKPGNSMSLPTAQGVVKLVRTAQGMSIEMPDGEISGKLTLTLNATQPPTFHVESAGTTMKTFAAILSIGAVDRPVVDMTGLTGAYDLAVDLSTEDALNVARAVTNLGAGQRDSGEQRTATASDPSGASVLSSIQNLGLRLELRKLPMDLLVVDRMEKAPTGN